MPPKSVSARRVTPGTGAWQPLRPPPLSPSPPPTLPVGQPHGMNHLEPPSPSHSPSMHVVLRTEKRGFLAAKPKDLERKKEEEAAITRDDDMEGVSRQADVTTDYPLNLN